MFRKFSVYYKPYIGIIILDLLCAALTTVCELVFPLIVRHTCASVGLLEQGVAQVAGIHLYMLDVQLALVADGGPVADA